MTTGANLRPTTPELLELCRPSIREIYIYWDSKRWDDKTSPHTRLSERGSILLPLSDDGALVDKILVYTEYKS